ncbi:MAG: hypothetical protein DRP84_09870 [Spirochaetes bacterium]|nr:MAG: hypothetical protein DRP84_09870 [Spirochaetota bacterium]
MDISNIVSLVFGWSSYIVPIILFFVWLKFWKGKYGTWMGVCNLVYFVIAIIVLIFNHRNDLDIYMIIPLLFIILAVLAIVILLSAYMVGLDRGVEFWKSITWKIIKHFGHPLIIYPTVLLLNIVFDLKLLHFILG